jgi:hypothetical protein
LGVRLIRRRDQPAASTIAVTRHRRHAKASFEMTIREDDRYEVDDLQQPEHGDLRSPG